MPLVNVKVRCGNMFLYDTKVYVDLNEPVRVLKSKICENDKDMHEDMMIVVYCGVDMENHNTISSYNVLEGCTVHVFKQIKQERPAIRKTYSEHDHVKLSVAFRSLSLNSSFSQAMVKLSKPEALNNLILTTPGLNEDPVALTLLQYPDLLCKVSEIDAVKRLIEICPSLASAVLNIVTTIHEEIKDRPPDSSSLSRSVFFPRFDPDSDIDDIQEMLDDSPASSESTTQAISRISSFGAITAAQLASAIASVTTQQSLPSTSGASTSSGSTGNVLDILSNIQSEQASTINDLPTNLQLMRDMGLTNDALNTEALRVGGTLENAIALVLSNFGFRIDD